MVVGRGQGVSAMSHGRAPGVDVAAVLGDADAIRGFKGDLGPGQSRDAPSMRCYRKEPDWLLTWQGEVEFGSVLAHRGSDLDFRAPRQDVGADGAVLVSGHLDPPSDRFAEQVRQLH